MRDRDIVVLKKVLRYSDEIDGTIARFDLDFNKFKSDYVVKNAIAMCVLQIGELAGKLTEEFKSAYGEMPWRDIISIRNRAAHAYESIDVEILWGIAVKNIPELKKYCEKILKEWEMLRREG
ncbi:MAG: DUF86 domain-containing protein [Oscillospiraceae bacterium]|nr:DUF86 domain-containing protein [Oscillospiraceae bacterium]